TNGLKEINNENYQPKHQSRCRKKGAGRKQIQTKMPNITQELNQLLQLYTKGDPENPLKWISKSTRNFETVLKEKGYKISDTTIASILKKQGYSLQTNKKTFVLTPSHPDCNA
ncbi:MAG: ISAzo13 family transposase, partial [Candidatus Bathyarchaeota archaeon]|nr:ISAzo13 family transposase [Candidatus Termiticorpusculum sp.]